MDLKNIFLNDEVRVANADRIHVTCVLIGNRDDIVESDHEFRAWAAEITCLQDVREVYDFLLQTRATTDADYAAYALDIQTYQATQLITLILTMITFWSTNTENYVYKKCDECRCLC